ncbi:Hint domain-containing protein [Xinfangfangia sp. CPCC 101601]|uniref:Hint domain-containing protein n=1 Tax=Pseudogemmobacter lacusdianii TaxID=3069608 RepID=A0ABU0VY13_9RHOB|nr:Hint domain-containing protein [Xinfangfangia sp. CPCC 101601]MDQ2066649.1 Hint domain-containing protein [Xinfangfangia sp. CPCC 101601]
MSANDLPGHACQLFAADAIYVTIGVNSGEGLDLPDQVLAGDIYELEASAQPLRLVMTRPAGGADPQVAAGSAVGVEGQKLRTEARYTMMSAGGDKVEILLLSIGGALFALPLSPLSAQLDYTLVKVETAPEETRLSDLICVSFARGTLITLATGAQKPVENLRRGDKILTRDHGPQPLRLLPRATVRAHGAFAPVVILAGTLGNSGDLIVSQHHRMFLYQRQRSQGLSTSELLVQAKHLVDDEKVFIREGGAVEFFSLVFDRHEIIYAEGIPAESLMVNDATVSRLPPEIAQELQSSFPGLTQVQHFGTEASRQFLSEVGPAALFSPAPRRRSPR